MRLYGIVVLSCSVMSDSLRPHGCSLVSYSPWGFSRQEYWVGYYAVLQGIFLTQGSNPGLPHWRRILGSSVIYFTQAGWNFICFIFFFNFTLVSTSLEMKFNQILLDHKVLGYEVLHQSGKALSYCCSWSWRLEKAMVTHSSTLAWRILMDCSWPGCIHGVSKSQTWLSN